MTLLDHTQSAVTRQIHYSSYFIGTLHADVKTQVYNCYWINAKQKGVITIAHALWSLEQGCYR